MVKLLFLDACAMAGAAVQVSSTASIDAVCFKRMFIRFSQKFGQSHGYQKIKN